MLNEDRPFVDYEPMIEKPQLPKRTLFQKRLWAVLLFPIFFVVPSVPEAVCVILGVPSFVESHGRSLRGWAAIALVSVFC